MRVFGRIRTAYSALAIFCLNALVVFAVLNALAWALRPAHDPNVPEPWPGLAKNIRRHAYPPLSEADAEVLARETMVRFQYEPFTDIRERPFDGRFIHVDKAGFRRGADQGPWPLPKYGYNVFVFGGSTTFGYGVMDRDTIASYLQPMLLAVAGRRVFVYNFGRCGYYSSQERILFERLLLAGHVPDAAIFIDGLNDFSRHDDMPFVAFRLARALTDTPPRQGLLDVFPLTETLRSAMALAHALQHASDASTPPPTPGAWQRQYAQPARADQVIERWIRSMRLIESMARPSGIATIFVWQPIASYEFPPGREHRLHNTGANGWAGFGYPRMRARVTEAPLGPNFLWCADVARDGTEGFYLDAVHYAPILARRVAECIASGIRERGLLRPPASRPEPVTRLSRHGAVAAAGSSAGAGLR